jgi:hypothetical protein
MSKGTREKKIEGKKRKKKRYRIEFWLSSFYLSKKNFFSGSFSFDTPEIYFFKKMKLQSSTLKWKDLVISPKELRLDTLRCGQSFRWKQLGNNQW